MERAPPVGPLQLHSFEAGPDAGVNLILKLAGQNPELEPLLLAVHYVGPLNSPGEEMRALFGDRGDFCPATMKLAGHIASLKRLTA